MRKTVIFLFLGIMLLVFHTFLIANTKDIKLEEIEKLELLDSVKIKAIKDGEIYY